MTLAKRNNFSEMFNIIDDFFEGPFAPFVRMQEDPVKITSSSDDSNYYIRAVVPGFSQEEVNITVDNKRLIISGKREQTKDNENLFSSSHMSFRQAHLLPQDAIGDNIVADMKNGILVVTIPRWNPSPGQNTKTIPIGNSPPKLE